VGIAICAVIAGFSARMHLSAEEKRFTKLTMIIAKAVEYALRNVQPERSAW